eukprot:scaffold109365_cov33-Phaeocystis_antarctica.AAC.1
MVWGTGSKARFTSVRHTADFVGVFLSCASTGGRSQSRANFCPVLAPEAAVLCATHRGWRGAATAHPHATHTE